MNNPEPAILVIDDCESLVKTVGSILQTQNYRVDTALNGSEALRKIHSNNYDLVLCDIDMPGMTGLDFLEKLRKDNQSLNVILMTGFLEPEYFIKAIRLGASDFISKPIEFQHLTSSISTLLSKNGNHDDLDSALETLNELRLELVINPRKFSQRSINQISKRFMEANLRLAPLIVNELLICVDEMVYNAFIHGTLGLTLQQRRNDHDALQEIITGKLNQPDVSNRLIRFTIAINQPGKAISISVEDDGEGFDYEAWLHNASRTNLLNLDEHGRGLAVLYHLADEVVFSNGGRRIRITKSILAGLPESV